MTKRAVAWVPLVLLVLVFNLPASATTRVDRDDVRGPLDLRRVSVDVLDQLPDRPVRLRLSASTYETWTVSQCRRAQELEDGCGIRFVLDTKGPAAWRPTGRGVDYWVAWRPRSCSLVAPETGEFITQGPSSKSPTGVTCVIRQNALEILKPIRWYVSTTWANRKHGWYASDYAPASGWLVLPWTTRAGG